MMKYLLVAVMALALGCAGRLEQGGAYYQTGQQPDKAFFALDSGYDIAYSAIDGLFKFERDNRLALWKISPDIKHTLDAVRLEAVKINRDWSIARKAYQDNPIPENLDKLQLILGTIQRLTAAAQAILIEKGIK